MVTLSHHQYKCSKMSKNELRPEERFSNDNAQITIVDPKLSFSTSPVNRSTTNCAQCHSVHSCKNLTM